MLIIDKHDVALAIVELINKHKITTLVLGAKNRYVKLLYKKHLQLASEKYGTSLQFDSLTCFMGPPILDTKDMTGRARHQSFWKKQADPSCNIMYLHDGSLISSRQISCSFITWFLFSNHLVLTYD